MNNITFYLAQLIGLIGLIMIKKSSYSYKLL